jgi:hypothetical protein
MENQCFDLHPCLHCGKTNHHLDKCQKKKKDKKKIIHYGWISSWQWNQQVKKLHKSYHLVQTQVKTHLHGEITKAKGFQTIVPDEYFGHDWGPILHVF